MKSLWTPDKSIHLPSPELVGFFLEVGAWDKAGRLYHQQRQRSRSPVQAFLKGLLAHMGEIGVTTTDTGGTPRGVTAHSLNFTIKGALGVDGYGIVIGTDNTVVDITDTKLVAQIMHGSGAGQMIHNAVATDTIITISDPDATFDAWRNFNNNSGASITVRETGMYCGFYAAGSFNFCIVRDVPTQIVVPDGGGCYVKYTAKITE